MNEKKELGDETQTARERPNAETGLAPCPICKEAMIETPADFLDRITLKHPHNHCILEDMYFAKDRWVKRVSLISSHEPKSTVEGENNKSVWVRTAERAPTEKEANLQGGVLASDGVMSMVQKWRYVIEHNWPFWMQIPALPEGVKS